MKVVSIQGQGGGEAGTAIGTAIVMPVMGEVHLAMGTVETVKFASALYGGPKKPRFTASTACPVQT